MTQPQSRPMKVRAAQWIDTMTHRTWWGVQVRFAGAKWMNVCRDGGPAFFDLRCDAEGFAQVLRESA
ncbi:hypothetical protein [Desulfocurvus vexinensis]|uniref:hypothetical protein n=1 Tax=Desulfocurvus vexinensis TaxID=399548 RepID=UPI00048C1DF8|nr:hypothetical protein [Desulfocurvus vexinensis]